MNPISTVIVLSIDLIIALVNDERTVHAVDHIAPRWWIRFHVINIL
jgi:hypothetical protein